MSYHRSDNFLDLRKFLLSLVIMTALVLVSFIVLQWLRIPSGHLVDWIVGFATFWWLLVIVTLPWNVHFQAREVLAEAEKSRETAIEVKPATIHKAQRWANRSLFAALALHVLSAAGLYIVAREGISQVGYLASVAAILLTLLRPCVRGYAYLMDQLHTSKQELLYPREDIVALKAELADCTNRIAGQESWNHEFEKAIAKIQNDLKSLTAAYHEMNERNVNEHNRLSHDADNAIAKITADGEFLNHIREILRFFKTA